MICFQLQAYALHTSDLSLGLVQDGQHRLEVAFKLVRLIVLRRVKHILNLNASLPL